MNPALLTAAAAMRARIESLEVIGNNIANASTTGYKADREFYRLFLTEQARADPETGEWSVMPVAEATAVDFAQGPIRTTHSPLDVALDGPGFLAVEGPDGPLLTRNGALRLAGDGTLLSGSGLPIRNEGGGTIVLPPEGTITIEPGGAVLVGGIAVGSLEIVEAEAVGGLRKAGSDLFAPPAGAPLQPASGTVVRQGALEGSNVMAPEAAVRLISVTRHFEMLRRATSMISDEMDGRAVQTLGRTS